MPAATVCLQKILYDHFNTTKDTLYNVAVNGDGHKYTTSITGTPSTDPMGHQQGIYLPDATAVYAQLDPGVVESMGNNAVAIYVGPVSGPDYGQVYLSQTAQGGKLPAELPYAARLLFLKASQEPVTLWHQGDRLATIHEVTQMRTKYYMGALQETLYKYAGRGIEIESIRPDSFAPISAQITQLDAHGDLNRSVVGEAFFLFTVKQTIIAPCMDAAH